MARSVCNVALNLAVEWGTRVRRRRAEVGMTQTELAAAVRTAGGNISRIERGEYVPSDEVRIKIAEALQVQVSDLFPYPDTRGRVVSA